MNFFILIILTICKEVYSEPVCVQKYLFAKTCHFYKITNSNGCYRYSLDNCKIVRTTNNEFKCPKYFCQEKSEVSKVYQYIEIDINSVTIKYILRTKTQLLLMVLRGFEPTPH